MTSISYEEIFASFLGNVRDYEMANLDYSDATTLMSEYLHKSLAQTYIRILFSSSSLDDELQTFSFEMDYPLDDSSDKDFVLNLLSKAMMIEWLTPKVNTTSLIYQMVGSDKSRTFYSQSAHLSELKNLLDITKTDVNKIITDRNAFFNSYLGDINEL